MYAVTAPAPFDHSGPAPGTRDGVLVHFADGRQDVQLDDAGTDIGGLIVVEHSPASASGLRVAVA
ncbi:hypothetical protein Sme01_40910 [Sphaerisporangium melleum]|uniref:Uncharacterized protein n=1 Tax=Sphaerisporangium melleum TaxID=321316 RepID=A0A917VPE4_9ACTN|nr:hypothetical protein GCM10007964_48710 [Sphaerisporangium melleum]GII71615.1 hypothetical protein Sme01_40910 [Sphaerisporangium melleum]